MRLSMAAGAFVGLLGFTGWAGFLAMAVWILVTSGLLQMRLGASVHDYFMSPSSMWNEGLSTACLVGVASWIDMVDVI